MQTTERTQTYNIIFVSIILLSEEYSSSIIVINASLISYSCFIPSLSLLAFDGLLFYSAIQCKIVFLVNHCVYETENQTTTFI